MSSAEAPPNKCKVADSEMELRRRAPAASKKNTNAEGKRPAASRTTRQPASKKPKLIAMTHTEPIAGCLLPATHPFTNSEVPRVRERIARHFQGFDVNDEKATVSVMEDLCSHLPWDYGRIGDAMAFWISNIQAELVQRECASKTACTNDQHSYIQQVARWRQIMGDCTVFAELVGDSAEASRNPVVDRVELLVYNAQRSNNRKAVRRSETMIRKWNGANAETEEVLDRSDQQKIQDAFGFLNSMNLARIEVDKQLATVEHAHKPWGWVKPDTRKSAKLLQEYYKDTVIKGGLFKRALKSERTTGDLAIWKYCQTFGDAEFTVATAQQQRVWGYIDAVSKNQTWLSAKADDARICHDKMALILYDLKALPYVLANQDAFLSEDSVLSKYRTALATWDERITRFGCMSADGATRLKEMSAMSTEDSAYLNQLRGIVQTSKKHIAWLNSVAEDAASDEEVMCTGTMTREEKDKELLATAVDLT